MPGFVIERDIPTIVSSSAEDLAGAAGASNNVLDQMQAEGKDIQWEHSYVAADKTFCIYQAENQELIEEHAERSGFPASIITEIKKRIDPSTAEA